MKKGLYYLALPYQGSEEEKKYRIEMSLKITTECLRQGAHVFAPILYVNKIATELNLSSIDKRRGTIMPYLLEFLRVSKGLLLVTLEGWQKSWGVNQELKFCHENNIPIYLAGLDQIFGNLKQILLTPLNQKEIDKLLETT